MKAAVGPPMATREPPKRETMRPETTAVVSLQAEGGSDVHGATGM